MKSLLQNSKKHNIKPAVIVAYYGGTDVINEINSRGFQTIRIELDGHKKTNQYLIQLLDHGQEIANDVVVTKKGQTLEELAQILNNLGVTHIIPADEAGVELSDLLCHQLNLPFNGIEYSKSRRNKSLMHQRIAKCGVTIPCQTIVTSLDDVKSWMLKQNLSYPIVIKPLDGAGSAGVSKCENDADVAKAFEAICSIADLKKTVVTIGSKFIAQEFLQGTEYVVDTVSLNGKHKLIDIWRCHKAKHNDGSFVYEYFDLLDSNDKVCKVLFDYVSTVLDALNIKIGPGHSEVYIKKDGSPVLVEIGARLGGPRMPFGTAPCVKSKKSQTEYTVDAYLEPSKFSDNWDGFYQKTKNSRMVFLVNYKEMILNSYDSSILNKIKSLKSFYHAEFAFKVGDKLKKTIDVRSSPGFIYLIHEDHRQIEHDYRLIRRYEALLHK